MTWVVILSIVVVSALKILITCLPTPVVKWLFSKFEVHTSIDLNAKVTVGGKEIIGEVKEGLIVNFNKGTFLKKYYIHPGSEQYFLHPGGEGTPIKIDTQIGKKQVVLLLYKYSDRIDVVKQYPKKMIAYSIHSDELQNGALV
ncbi:YfmQ family protein [Priestia megaterium]|uniref:YfmQ family protein n=1 Tax=Priestia megaterium TaxID=1404 RepID=UPI002E1A377A|nr:YfmQ family protein [Priestia megaterium]